MLRRLVIGLLVSLAIPIVGIPCWIALHRSDLPSAGDEDLLAFAAEPAASEPNGFEDFAAAAEAADIPKDEYAYLDEIRRGERSDPEWVEATFARNRDALARLERGVSRAVFRVPPDVQGFEEDCCEVWLDVQLLLKISGAHAGVEAASGRGRPFERTLMGLRASRQVSRGDGTDLLAMMFAAALRSIALYDLETVVRRSPVSPERARSLVAALEAARWRPSDWESMWAVEYSHTRALVAEVAAVDVGKGLEVTSLWRLLPADYAWQPNRTLSGWADIYRGLQRRAALDCRTIHDSVEGEADTGWLRFALSPNPVGRIVTRIASPNFERFDQHRCYGETRISLTQTLIAVKAYAEAQGSLPPTLEALVPELLERVPEDRFDGAPIRYSRDRRVVYSIGDDFADAGGGEEQDPSNRAEPALSLAF